MVSKPSFPLKGLVILLSGALLLSSCYQAHSDDDLRTVPVTNNPHIVPGGGAGNFSAVGY